MRINWCGVSKNLHTITSLRNHGYYVATLISNMARALNTVRFRDFPRKECMYSIRQASYGTFLVYHRGFLPPTKQTGIIRGTSRGAITISSSQPPTHR